MERSVHAGAREGQFLGQLEFVGGFARWPFGQMEIGDWFTVNPDDKSAVAVSTYAYQTGRRLKRKFAVVSEEDAIAVTRIDEKEDTLSQSHELRAKQAILVGGDGENDLGVLKPPEVGQWAWPFAIMNPGQYFYVDHLDRHPERVRMFAGLRAKQLEMAVSVAAHAPEKPGFCKITYVDKAKETVNRTLSVNATDPLGMHLYGKQFYDFGFQQLQDHMGGSVFHKCKQLEKPRFDKFVMQDFNGYADFYFELFEDGVRITSIPKGMSAEAYERMAEDERDAMLSEIHEERARKKIEDEERRKKNAPVAPTAAVHIPEATPMIDFVEEKPVISYNYAADIVRKCYVTDERRYQVDKDDARVELGMADWPVAEIGDVDRIPAMQIAKPAEEWYLFNYPLDGDIGMFVMDFKEDEIVIERVRGDATTASIEAERAK